MTIPGSRRNRISTLARLRSILATTTLYGGKALVRRLHLLHLVPLAIRLRRRPARFNEVGLAINGEDLRVSATLLRELLERLGPTFVKLGQILSLRADIVGEDISVELSKLQSDAQPFSYAEAAKTVREELGKTPEELFSFFDPDPVAAASLAQVHRALLRDGTEVALKIQRPGIRKTIEQDVALLRYLARLVERHIPEVRPYNPVRVIDEFADWTWRELDFAVEGHNAERFRFAFQDNPHIKIPLIYWEYTTPRILAMEYVSGIRADDTAAIEAQGLDRKELALHGVDAQFQQILVDGFFHADPHPGNSFAMRGNVLCFYDFGMVGYLKQSQRRELISCFVAFTNKDMENFLTHFLHIAEPGRTADVASFEKDASEILNEMFFSPTNPSAAWIFFRLMNRAARRGISFPANLALFSKALITTEAMGLALYPGFDFDRHLAPFIKKAFEAYVDPTRIGRSFANDFIDYVALMRGLPERVDSVLKALGDERGRKSLADDEEMRFLEGMFRRHGNRRLAETSLLAAAILLAVIGVTLKPSMTGLPILYLGVVIFAVLFLVFFIRARKKG